MDLAFWLLVVAAFGGGIISALLGWAEAESSEAFNPRKFLKSVLRSLLAGGAAAVSYHYVGPITAPVLLGAALAGAGVDIVGKRLAGSITQTGPTTTSPPK